MIEVLFLLWLMILTVICVFLIISRDSQETSFKILIDEIKGLKRRMIDIERHFEPITCTTLDSDYNAMDCPNVKRIRRKPKIMVREDD